MKKLIILLLIIITSCAAPKTCCGQINFDQLLKFSTIYAAGSGGTSISDVDVFSIENGLQTSKIQTPYDYNLSLGIRKIARFGYENKAKAFYDGTETNYSDAATVGKVRGLEYLFEVNYARQQGKDFIDQHHFVRWSSDDGCETDVCINFFALKFEYLEDGFADVRYFEASERYRYRKHKHLSWNIGLAHRLAEPYGYDPLAEWMLSNGNLHYTYLAIQEGYNIDVHNSVYSDPNGNVVATSPEVWEAVVIPEVLADYTEKKRNELKDVIQHSLVVGFDYYKYNKKTWLHAWGSVLPYHYDDGSEFSYHNYIDGDQWYDYSGGLIYGIKVNKSLGYFFEGKYNKYWNREWYDFKCGINYVIF